MRAPAACLIAALAASSGIWLDVPFVRQEKNGCGAAALSMVLQYWARNGVQMRPEDADASRIAGQLLAPQARGIFAAEMVRYLEANGFRAFAFRATWEDLEHHLEKGRPLIVCLGRLGSNLHYVVVSGLDRGRDLILLNDPAQRKLLPLDRAAFEKRWKAVDNWALLAVPRRSPGS